MWLTRRVKKVTREAAGLPMSRAIPVSLTPFAFTLAFRIFNWVGCDVCIRFPMGKDGWKVDSTRLSARCADALLPMRMQFFAKLAVNGERPC
jgi:hypothetical protein